MEAYANYIMTVYAGALAETLRERGWSANDTVALIAEVTKRAEGKFLEYAKINATEPASE